DDAASPLVYPIGLNVAVAERRVSPAAAEQLAERVKGWSASFGWSFGVFQGISLVALCRIASAAAGREPERDAEQHRHRAAGLGRQINGQIHPRAVGFVTHAAHNALHDRRAVASGWIGFGYLPGDLRRILRDAAINIGLIKIEDFWSPPLAPHLRAGHA